MSVARYRVDIAGLVGGPGLSTWHFDTTASGYTDQDAVDAVENFFLGAPSLTSNNITFTGQPVIDILDEASGQVTAQNGVSGWSVAGTRTDEELPPTTQGLVEWQTGIYVAGRQIRGKTFMPGITIDHNDPPGVPGATYKSGLAANALSVITASVGFGIYSRKNGQIALVTSLFIWNQWAVLRGRRDG